MSEQHLPGGYINPVARVGDTVRRPPGPRAEFVHRLLELFERRDWPGAPRFLGVDAHGREILSFVDGHVAWAPTQPPAVESEESLVGVATLVRQFHDLTAATPLAGAEEVVCHNDLSPKNTATGISVLACARWPSLTGTSPHQEPACTTWPTCAGSTFASARR